MKSQFLKYKIMDDMLKSRLTVFKRHACGVKSLVIMHRVVSGHFDGGPLFKCALRLNK